MADALEELGQTFDERLKGIDDSAQLVAAGFRLSARLADSRPELMQVLRHRGLGHINSDSGLAQRALRDLEVGVASGRFTIADPTIAVAALGGSLPALLELRFARPEPDGDEAASNLAEMHVAHAGRPSAGRPRRRPAPAARPRLRRGRRRVEACRP